MLKNYWVVASRSECWSFPLSTRWVWLKKLSTLLFHIPWNQSRPKNHHGRVRHLSLCCDIVVESWNWVAAPFHRPAEMMGSQTLALKSGVIRTFSFCVPVLITFDTFTTELMCNFGYAQNWVCWFELLCSYFCNIYFLYCQYNNNNHFAFLLLSLQRCSFSFCPECVVKERIK